jgi:hypothetical protein
MDDSVDVQKRVSKEQWLVAVVASVSSKCQERNIDVSSGILVAAKNNNTLHQCCEASCSDISI